MTDITPHLTRLVTSSDIPADALHVARLSLLDWVACGLAGVAEPVAQITRDIVLGEGTAGQATLFGGGRASLRGVALVNGATSHALDYDDTHFAHIGHPSVAVFPAVLALAEEQGATVQALLTSALVGMEASTRAGVWLGRSHYQVGYHMTATAGALGAACGAAHLLRFDVGQVAQALGLAATRAAGLKAQFGTMGKPWNAGIAAEAGLEAALLVSRGFIANPGALDGPLGFGATHHGEGNDPGTDWRFAQVSHKFHACCHGLHAALEALAATDSAAPELAELVVHTHPRWLTVCNQPAPETGLGAKFSYRTALALALAGRDTARLDTWSDRWAVAPQVLALRDLVQVEADESLTEMQARIEVLKRDGSRVEATHDLDALPDLDRREARVRRKAAALIGAERAEALWRLVCSTQAGAGDLAGTFSM